MRFLRSVALAGVLCVGSGGMVWGQEVGQPPQQQQQQQSPPPAASPKPRLVTAPDDPYDKIDGVFSVSLIGWASSKRPVLRNGQLAATNRSSIIDFAGATRPIPGVLVTAPAGKGNNLRLSYWRSWQNGTTTVGRPLSLYGAQFDPGDVTNTKYTMQAANITWDFLSWPAPAEGSFRFKTLWGVQYVTISSEFDAPLKKDSSGTVVGAFAQGSQQLIYPSLGLGFEKFFSRHFRFEMRAQGFGLPGKATLYDGEGLFAYKFGKFELGVGGKAFHFSMSKKEAERYRATMPGAMVQVRWYPE